MRLIDAEALLEDFKSRAIKARNWKEKAILDDDQERIIRADATLTFLTEVKLTIEDAPTVNPEPYFEKAEKDKRKGKWIDIGNTGACNFCSVCKEFILSTHLNFCSNCGADMRGGKE